jgi:hypothetical protein
VPSLQGLNGVQIGSEFDRFQLEALLQSPIARFIARAFEEFHTDENEKLNNTFRKESHRYLIPGSAFQTLFFLFSETFEIVPQAMNMISSSVSFFKLRMTLLG